jgi:nucleotide-binding universal stress UspA family protein
LGAEHSHIARPCGSQRGTGRRSLINRILVPLDGSAAAEAVLPFVTKIAQATGSDVLLVSAVTPIAVWDEAHAAVKWEAEEGQAGDYLQARRNELAHIGLTVQSRVVFGAAAEAILRIAMGDRADLIAITTHGRSGLARWVLGSVTAKLVHATNTPILVVRPPADGTSTAGANITKMLVPLDGSEAAASVLPFAADLAKSFGAKICLFQAVPEPVTAYPDVQEEVEASARQFLASAAERLSEQGVQADSVASFGNTVDGIVWAAEREKAELIVMSTHGRSGIGRMVLGSVADAVVRRASMPVILVRPKDKEEVRS